MAAFIIWTVVGVAFIGLGVYVMLSEKQAAFSFWANIKMEEVTDVKKYNKALGKLWCFFGAVFILLGTPLLPGQNKALIFVSVVGAMFDAIGAMVIYTLGIERKYRKK